MRMIRNLMLASVAALALMVPAMASSNLPEGWQGLGWAARSALKCDGRDCVVKTPDGTPLKLHDYADGRPDHHSDGLPNTLRNGTPVVIVEDKHGTNVRIALTDKCFLGVEDDTGIFYCGHPSGNEAKPGQDLRPKQ